MMPEQREVSLIADGRIQYTVEPSVYNAPEIGDYIGYDIAAVDSERGGVVARVADVTCDRALANAMAERFNRCRLSLVHLKDAVLDMLL